MKKSGVPEVDSAETQEFSESKANHNLQQMAEEAVGLKIISTSAFGFMCYECKAAARYIAASRSNPETRKNQEKGHEISDSR